MSHHDAVKRSSILRTLRETRVRSKRLRASLKPLREKLSSIYNASQSRALTATEASDAAELIAALHNIMTTNKEMNNEHDSDPITGIHTVTGQ